MPIPMSKKLKSFLERSMLDEYDNCPKCNPEGDSGTCGNWDCDVCCFEYCDVCAGLGWVLIA